MGIFQKMLNNSLKEFNFKRALETMLFRFCESGPGFWGFDCFCLFQGCVQ